MFNRPPLLNSSQKVHQGGGDYKQRMYALGSATLKTSRNEQTSRLAHLPGRDCARSVVLFAQNRLRRCARSRLLQLFSGPPKRPFSPSPRIPSPFRLVSLGCSGDAPKGNLATSSVAKAPRQTLSNPSLALGPFCANTFARGEFRGVDYQREMVVLQQKAT